MAESGPNAPPQGFWCLIVARDGLISQARELGALVEAREEIAKKSLLTTLVYSSLYAGTLTL